MPNMLDFDNTGTGVVSIPQWTLEDGASVVFSDIIVGSNAASAGIILGYSSNTSTFTGWVGGNLRVSVGGVSNTTSDNVSAGDRVSITVSRSGSVVTAQVDNNTPVNLSPTSGFDFDQLGRGSFSFFPMNGSIAGTITMTGTDSRIYDTNQPLLSTTLVDTVGAQNGTLSGGVSFVDDPDAGIDLGAGADVWLLAGQSQIKGVNTISVGTDDDYTGLSNIYQYGESGVLKQAVNTLEHNAVDDGTFGLWREFILEVLSDGLDAGRPQILVPAAVSGSSFPFWSQGGNNYNTAVSRTNAAVALNNGNVLKGALWWQGESNLGDGEVTHQANLEAMHAGMVTDITSMSASTPWVCGLLHPNIIVGPSTAQDVIDINAAITAFSGGLSSSSTVDVSSYVLNLDGIHLDAASIRSTGTDFADAFDALLNPPTSGELTPETIQEIAQAVWDKFVAEDFITSIQSGLATQVSVQSLIDNHINPTYFFGQDGTTRVKPKDAYFISLRSTDGLTEIRRITPIDANNLPTSLAEHTGYN